LGLSRNLPPRERLLKRQGYLRSPITAHFPVRAANFGPGEILRETSTESSVAFQRDLSAWPFSVAFQRGLSTSVWTSKKPGDLNPYQQEAIDYFVKQKKDVFVRRHSFG